MPSGAGRITLWHIEVFVAVAEERSVSAAARRLGASPSAVSQQVSNLEAALSAELLDRDQRPMVLTPAGEMFRRRAQTILNEAEQARLELSAPDMSYLTRMRLGMIEDFEADVTPRLLSRLSEELRGCQFLLETGASHFLQDQLDARALDVIVAAEMGAPADWMEVHPVMVEGFVVAVPRGLDGAGTDLPSALKRLPLVQYTQRHHMGRLIADHLARQNLTVDHRFEIDSYHAILALVAAGAGWTILTPLALMRARRFAAEIDVYPLPFAPLERTISLIARRDVLKTMPGTVAGQLRGIVDEVIVRPARAAYPFLDESLRLV
ncbi:LysR family transcriptional regulator [Mesobacterium pallidum]|uniref:LysR family transcriptional regulator n=1 Tax=Mesobacterium pallidum TaxID=2872037 RepID=UPI001EE2AAF6